MTRVKICGLTNLADAVLACELGAHAVGFVFAKSPRRADPDTVAEICPHLPPFVARVGVFVNEPPNVIRELAQRCGLNVAQLHGEEPPDYINQLPGLQVVRAFRLRGEADLEPLARWPQDTVLIEPYLPHVLGGSGRQLDLDLASRATQCGKRVILAGGLTPDNVGQAILQVRPYTVDASSGLELQPGQKDPDKLRRFFEAVHQADDAIEKGASHHVSTTS